jgi:hypothetical protein
MQLKSSSCVYRKPGDNEFLNEPIDLCECGIVERKDFGNQY